MVSASVDDVTKPSDRRAAPVRITTDGVSIVLPTFNLAGTVATTVQRLRDELLPVAPTLEFVVVDDGSTDATAEVALALCRASTDVRFVRNRRNLGKGFAVYLGLLRARYSTVCFTDADLAFAPGSYARVVARLVSGSPFVVASRRLPDSEIIVRMNVLGYAARRHFVGVTFNRLIRAALHLPFHDTQCGLKGFSRDVGIELFRRVRSAQFLFDVELFLAAREAGISVEEVPVSVQYRDEKSSVALAGDSMRMLLGLVRIWRRQRLGDYRRQNTAMDPDSVYDLAEELPLAGASSGSG